MRGKEPDNLREVIEGQGHQYIETPNPDKANFRNCDMCSHLFVCDIAKHTAAMLASQYDEKHLPFKYQDLAKICQFFTLRTGDLSKELAKE